MPAHRNGIELSHVADKRRELPRLSTPLSRMRVTVIQQPIEYECHIESKVMKVANPVLLGTPFHKGFNCCTNLHVIIERFIDFCETPCPNATITSICCCLEISTIIYPSPALICSCLSRFTAFRLGRLQGWSNSWELFPTHQIRNRHAYLAIFLYVCPLYAHS